MRFAIQSGYGLVAMCALAVGSAQAETPPIKPGLWQVQTERLVDGKKTVEMSEQMKEQMKGMPPEVRQKMEEMMRKSGVDMSGAAGMKMCLSRESLDQGNWQGERTGCKTEFTSRTKTSWKWRSKCDQPPSTSEGDSEFKDTENYTVNSSTTMTMDGRPQTTKMTLKGKWLGADCGTLQPVLPPKMNDQK